MAAEIVELAQFYFVRYAGVLSMHVFGMAKSPLKLKGAITRNLELDFLRLVYAVEHFRASGDEAIGYMAVLTEAIARRIAAWTSKYGAHDCVRVQVVSISDEDRLILESEKDRNRLGNQPLADPTLASADFGRKIVEDALRARIRTDFPGIAELPEKDAPLGVRWDFYGVVR